MDAAVEFLKKVGLEAQDNLVGVKDDDIDAICESSTAIPIKTYMRAAARMAQALASLSRRCQSSLDTGARTKALSGSDSAAPASA